MLLALPGTFAGRVGVLAPPCRPLEVWLLAEKAAKPVLIVRLPRGILAAMASRKAGELSAIAKEAAAVAAEAAAPGTNAGAPIRAHQALRYLTTDHIQDALKHMLTQIMPH